MQRGFMIPFAASVKSARERVGASWMPENSDGGRSSPGFCAGARSPPRPSSSATQPAPTSHRVAERNPGLFPRRLFRRVDRMVALLARGLLSLTDRHSQRANLRRGPWRALPGRSLAVPGAPRLLRKFLPPAASFDKPRGGTFLNVKQWKPRDVEAAFRNS